jgi:hypothetical protein
VTTIFQLQYRAPCTTNQIKIREVLFKVDMAKRQIQHKPSSNELLIHNFLQFKMNFLQYFLQIFQRERERERERERIIFGFNAAPE